MEVRYGFPFTTLETNFLLTVWLFVSGVEEKYKFCVRTSLLSTVRTNPKKGIIRRQSSKNRLPKDRSLFGFGRLFTRFHLKFKRQLQVALLFFR